MIEFFICLAFVCFIGSFVLVKRITANRKSYKGSQNHVYTPLDLPITPTKPDSTIQKSTISKKDLKRATEMAWIPHEHGCDIWNCTKNPCWTWEPDKIVKVYEPGVEIPERKKK